MRKSAVIVISVCALLAVSLAAGAQDGSQLEGTVPAPDFPAGLDWINVDAPLTLQGLRGKIVLLDFWTYGCINCIHEIPVLQQLEQLYPQELVIISVHSAKFDTEGDTANIRQIVQRYGIEHPVINDHEFRVWRLYGAQGWPTFVVIDPLGNLLARDSAEFPLEVFTGLFDAMIAYYDQRGELARSPLDVTLESARSPGTPLLFPGKALADSAGNRLFIADTNHNRIVIADLTSYAVLDLIGSGRQGLADGGYDEAAFNKPQGMALSGGTLYVADTYNHAIRAVDLDAQTVFTIAGTGEMGRTIPRPGQAAEARSIALRSPWDVALGPDASTLYIAMAGAHQIWVMNLDDGTIRAAVGDGRESLVNRTPETSSLAQPSGLYFTDGRLYFADSESSSIRVADFSADTVATVAGPELPDPATDADRLNILFQFGDQDGIAGESRLQHALGVTGAPDGTLYVADTYNSRIRAIDPATTQTTTLFGLGGEGGFRDGGPDAAQFDEPGGLSYADGRLYVADTNNHAIRVIDLAAGTVTTIQFPNVEALQVDEDAVTVLGGNAALGETVELDPQTIAPGDGQLTVRITLPEGYKINDLIDSTLDFSVDSDAVQIASQATVDSPDLSVPVTFTAGETMLSADLTLYYCREGENSLCFVDMVTFHVPVTVAAGGETALALERTVTPPRIEN